MPLSEHLLRIREKVGHDLLILPSAAVAILDEQGRILMGLHSERSLWVLPGGLIEPGELPADGAVREVWEETGLFVELTGILGVFGGENWWYYSMEIASYVNVVFLERSLAAPSSRRPRILETRYVTKLDYSTFLIPAGWIWRFRQFFRSADPPFSSRQPGGLCRLNGFSGTRTVGRCGFGSQRRQSWKWAFFWGGAGLLAFGPAIIAGIIMGFHQLGELAQDGIPKSSINVYSFYAYHVTHSLVVWATIAFGFWRWKSDFPGHLLLPPFTSCVIFHCILFAIFRRRISGRFTPRYTMNSVGKRPLYARKLLSHIVNVPCLPSVIIEQAF
jgi:8-oxo-dGTP pyrophosphatase MutT (NUDIX family)